MNNTKHYDMEISLFIDNELSDSGQKDLFGHLSTCEYCRASLSKSMELKKRINKRYAEMNPGMINPYKNMKNALPGTNAGKIYKITTALGIAATIILGFFLALTDISNNKSEAGYKQLTQEVSALNEKIKLLSDTKVRTDTCASRCSTPLKNFNKRKTRQTNITQPEKQQTPVADKKVQAPIKYHSQYASMPVVKITKDDFLVQQMGGD